METGIRFDRLETLAQHLETGVLGHERFDFGSFNDGAVRPNECGTAGCGIGECPVIWPGEWKFGGGLPLLIGTKPNIDNVNTSVEVWFGLAPNQVDHLFYPYLQNCDEYGGEIMGDDATRYDVAANIRAFIEKMRTPAG